MCGVLPNCRTRTDYRRRLHVTDKPKIGRTMSRIIFLRHLSPAARHRRALDRALASCPAGVRDELLDLVESDTASGRSHS